MKTTAFALVGTVLIIIHTELPPTDDEWQAYMEIVKSIKDISRLRSIAFTDGGAPNSRQRKEINDFLKGRSSPAAVVSGNTLVRGVVTALNWFNPLVRAFSPDRIMDAYQYLKLTRDEINAINKTIMRLQQDLGVKLRCLSFIGPKP